jgi:hypothetical protein
MIIANMGLVIPAQKDAPIKAGIKGVLARREVRNGALSTQIEVKKKTA